MRADKKRILIVDDEPAITRLLKLNLEQTGEFVVRTVNSPDAALSAALEFLPDLMLLDVIMPGMDGGYLASMLQESPKLKGVPIVFLTAAVTKTEVKDHPTIGGYPFISKPLELTEIIACLHSQLEGQASASGP
jgi:DNA-binding response OmpR family regulator